MVDFRRRGYKKCDSHFGGKMIQMKRKALQIMPFFQTALLHFQHIVYSVLLFFNHIITAIKCNEAHFVEIPRKKSVGIRGENEI